MEHVPVPITQWNTLGREGVGRCAEAAMTVATRWASYRVADPVSLREESQQREKRIRAVWADKMGWILTDIIDTVSLVTSRVILNELLCAIKKVSAVVRYMIGMMIFGKLLGLMRKARGCRYWRRKLRPISFKGCPLGEGNV